MDICSEKLASAKVIDQVNKDKSSVMDKWVRVRFRDPGLKDQRMHLEQKLCHRPINIKPCGALRMYSLVSTYKPAKPELQNKDLNLLP